ncbi:MAG TPA: c-type cytochrome domain-containing protein [Fimbriimonadaceae bacterium]|nr:c-type cytochrome domain-containing protein [Fimbriimonadaceae bacterium]
MALAGLFAAFVVPLEARAKPLSYKDVAPLFKANCVACHKGPRPAHGLDLTTYKKIMQGDSKGKVVVVGKPTISRLATVLHGKPQAMPPGRDLRATETNKIEAWIRAGAKEK